MSYPNQNPYRRGFSRNGAPQGYGQQRGASPFLDQPSPEGEREVDPSAPQPVRNAADAGAPAAPAPPTWQRALDRPGRQLHRGEPESGTYGRGPETAAQAPAPPAYGRGFGSPEDGYGPGGVANPAYRGQQDTPEEARFRTAAGAFAGGGVNVPPPGGSVPPPNSDPGGQPPPPRRFTDYGVADIAGEEKLQWGDPSRMTGFNTNAWGTNERGSNTVKNSFGKIASRYDPRSPKATRAVMADPDFQRLFPEAKLIEHPKGDLIDFGDGNPVDVLRNAVEDGSGDAWAFQVGGPGGPPPGPGGPVGGPPPAGGAAPGGLPTEGMAAKLLAALQAQQQQAGGGGVNSNVSIEKLLADLGLL